jgi:hypothetical protein
VTTTASPAPSPASAGGTVSVSGPIGRFPLPPGAQLIEDGTDNGHYDIVFGSVSPSEASRFYTTALPRAGYTITSNSSAAEDSFSGTGIWFTGHGYNGQIGALSSFDISGISFGANTVEITLTPAVRPRPEAAGKGNPAGQGGLRQLPGAAALPGIRPDHPPGIRDLGRLGRKRTTAAAPAMAGNPRRRRPGPARPPPGVWK